ncbi:MAG: aldehyde dehydrogenase family protein [Spongiibacteraceae bacterium]|jgi:acyl-CoA reductase-like NAD-dependent aldehyde dehydrogenase|nr:aldehyde dehydrogenase family protein [Spongiibacteraceae bacterium]
MKQFKLLIGGKLVDGASTMDVINPAKGEAFQTCPRADEAQLNEAVAAAKAAFPAWSARPIDERRELLLALADAIEARADEFAETLTLEQGKPLQQAKFETMGTAGTLRVFAGMSLEPKVVLDDDTSKVIEHRAPLGVVAAITPWNFPLVLLANKLGPALLAGNTMVLKPAPTTPLTTLLVGELCAELFPAGVVNTITDQNDLGGVLTAHPDVAKVAFTGSTATGKKVLSSVASTLKRVTLELGGNDAALVLDDVDVKDVAQKIFNGATFNAGQICVAIKRVYVPDAIYDEFCDELARLAREAVVGEGTDPSTQIGPIQNRMQFEKVKELLEDAKANGKIIAGGEPLSRPGYFIPPTIVRDVTDDSRIVAEEQFAPVLPVLRYSDLDDAIARVNDSIYGLGGTVWGKDVERAQAVAMRINSGTVWVNKHLDMNPMLPFRGSKQSGIGVECGEEGLYEYTQARLVNMAKPGAA